MGFAWEPANVSGSGMPDGWDCPPSSPRRRERPHRPVPGPAACARAVTTAIAAASRRAKAVISARPPLADHRRAF